MLLFRGADIKIKDGVVIRQPTLGEICDYGESKYFAMIGMLVCTPTDLKWQLNESGIDYTKMTEFELFCTMISNQMSKDKTHIVFGSLDLQKFKAFVKDDSDDIVLIDLENGIQIDEYTYFIITDILRKIHGFKKNEQIPGNEHTKQILIKDAKEEYFRNINKPYDSQLKNQISALVNIEGFKYNHSNVWDLNIGAFLDSVKRIFKIKEADTLLQSGYSGYGIDLKSIDKKQLDWLGELS